MTRLVSILCLALLATVAAAGPATAARREPVRISAFLSGVPDPSDPSNPNAFRISGCFAASGAVVDAGGAPVRIGGVVVGCGDPSGIAGSALFEGPLHMGTGDPTSFTATHTLFGARGTIQMRFEGSY